MCKYEFAPASNSAGKYRKALLLGLIVLAGFKGSSTAQQREPGTAPALTADDLSAFLDGVVSVQLRRDDIAGAVVAIVKDGRLLFASGYGYSDVESKKPVSPGATLFRPGSVSKLFACTAVMQLVEQGKLDLDADVNQYLDFQIPATYPQPITLRHLMTHTAGFQETIRRIRVPEGGKMQPLKEYLPDNLPPRVFPAGTTPSYSNYGTALAAYAVERVSGLSFEDYVDQYIFRPLGMTHSTYAQPLPDSLKAMMSTGYINGSEPAKPFELIQTFPGGGLTTTAEDMSRFMIAHLQDGSLGESRILKPETARLMNSRQFELMPSMNGSALGFAEGTRNGYRLLGHGGNIQAFHSQLYLVPDLRLGFFISQNSRGRSGSGVLRKIVWESFFDRYFPAGATSMVNEQALDRLPDISELDGNYKTTRRFDLSIFKLWSLTGQVWVRVKPDGSITSDLITEHGQPKTLRAVASMKYCDEKGQDCLAFRKGESGETQAVTTFPHAIFQRVPWFETRQLNLAVLGVSAGVFALTVVMWPVGTLVRWHYGRRLDLTRSQRRRRLFVGIVCALDLAFIIAGQALFRKLPDPSLEIWLPLIQVVGMVGAVGSLFFLYDAARCWRDSGRWWFSKLHAVALVLAGLGFVCFALIWNLFDFSGRY